MNPKELFEKLAHETWERLRLSWEYDISQGEETITDLLQLEIARFGPPNIHVIKTTKANEAKHGLDWEWWIGNKQKGWLRFVIQAKKIYDTGRYDALNHRVKLPGGNSLLQHNLLKRYAATHGAIPLYCLFNHVPLNVVEQNRHWHCSAHFDCYQFGCTLTSVKRIEEALNKHGCRNFDFIHKSRDTFPWRCLFCPECDGLSVLLISSFYKRDPAP